MTTFNTTIGRRIWWALAWFNVATSSCWAQKASNWRVYKLADRLPESACISVTVSPQGRVLARHFNLPIVTELDGYTVRTIPSPEIGRGKVYQSPAGQLWSAVPDGLQEFAEEAWVLHRVPEIAAAINRTAFGGPDPVPLWPLRQGLVLLLLPQGLLEFNSEDTTHPHTQLLREAGRTYLGSFSSLAPARDGGLWIGGARGVAKIPAPIRNLRADTAWQEYPAPESLQVTNLQGVHEDEEGGVTMVGDSSTNQQRVVVYFDGRSWSAHSAGAERLRQAWRGPDKSRWAMSTETLFEGDPAHAELAECEEISARAYLDVAVQAGVTFWLATSDGLFRYAPALWRVPAALKRISSPVHCLASDPAGGIWFTAGASLYLFSGEQFRPFAFPAQIGRNLQDRALFVLRNGTVIMVTEDAENNRGDVLFALRPGASSLQVVDTGNRGPVRALGLLADGRLSLHYTGTSESESQASLRTYDGNSFQKFPEPAPSGMMGTNYQALFVAQNGDLWLSAEHGVGCYSENKWRLFLATGDKSTPEGAIWFTEMTDGRIWCAGLDRIWEFDGHNWSEMRGGFDRINALARSRDGSVWVASNNGAYRYLQGTWIENGPEEGLPSAAIRDIHEDQRGRLWAATTRGLSVFHPEADPDPPQTSVQMLPGPPNNNLPEGGAISMIFGGEDKWKYTPRERLLYSYRLDVQDWTPFSDVNRISLPELPAGKHYFQVRAMDRNGNVDQQAARREFIVVPPWYKETRLVLISGAGALLAFFFAGVAFNRHRRLLRSYAEVERTIAERTHQLEVANRELVHSQKMNALGTLAAGIAHDFNNILSIVKGSTQIIEENLENPQKIRTRLDRIKLVVEQGAGIVKAMLGFSRDSGLEPALCNLNDVVQDTLKLLGDRFLREVQVNFRPAPGLPAVLAAKDFIQQILLNFIFNAAESMDNGKQIVLRTKLAPELPADLVLLPLPAARYVTVSVQDSGCGIPPENLPRIFEPFFTTKALSTRRGTGLGLSMVYTLAKKLGAGLAVESVVAQGSTFSLILPVRDLAEKP